MDATEVLARLKTELKVPRLTVKLEEKEYSEADFQAIKQELVQYFEDYVRNVEH